MLQPLRGRPRGGDTVLAQRIDRARILLDDFLFEIAEMMASQPCEGAAGPGVREGHEETQRRGADSRSRDRHGAMSDPLRQAFARALGPLAAAGLRVEPDFGDCAAADLFGLEGDGAPRADVFLEDRSGYLDPDGGRSFPSASSWCLSVALADDLSSVVGATCRPLEGIKHNVPG